MPFHQIARRLEVHQRDLRHQQVALHPLPLTGALAFPQRSEYAQRRMQAGGQIGHRRAGTHRAFTRMTGDAHEATHALRDLIKTRPLAVGAILTEAGNRGQDDARVDLAQRLVVDAKAELHIRAKVLHHHIGSLDQRIENGATLFRLHVQGHGALVAMQVLHVMAMARPAHAVGLGRLDLDDVRAEIGKLLDAGRAGTHPRQIKNAQLGKRAGGGNMRHGGAISGDEKSRIMAPGDVLTAGFGS